MPKAFSTPNEMIRCFFFFLFLHTMYCIKQCAHIKPFLGFWDEACLIIVDELLNVLRYLFANILLRTFASTFISKTSQWFSFLLDLYVVGLRGNTGLVKQIEQCSFCLYFLVKLKSICINSTFTKVQFLLKFYDTRFYWLEDLMLCSPFHFWFFLIWIFIFSFVRGWTVPTEDHSSMRM